jgi:hypothetical protein
MSIPATSRKGLEQAARLAVRVAARAGQFREAGADGLEVFRAALFSPAARGGVR